MRLAGGLENWQAERGKGGGAEGVTCDIQVPILLVYQWPHVTETRVKLWASCMHSLMSSSSHLQQCSQAEDMKLFGDLIVKVSKWSFILVLLFA